MTGIQRVVEGVFRSGLPRARDIAVFAEHGGLSTVVDFTQRERPTVRRACERNGVVYTKHPLAYEGGDFDAAVDVVLAARRPVLFHCFHGRDRTGVVARRVIMREEGRVYLVGVGRNLNRAVRTCEAFGVRRLVTVGGGAEVHGRLFGAKGRVALTEEGDIPSGFGVLALECGTGRSVHEVDFSSVRTVVLGGESKGLPRRLRAQYAHIPMCGQVSGLTVEAALAIALAEWRRP